MEKYTNLITVFEHLAASVTNLDSHLQERSGEKSGNGSSAFTEGNLLFRSLNHMHELLSEFNIEAEDYLSFVLDKIDGRVSPERIQKLKAEIDRFDYKSAIISLRSISRDLGISLSPSGH